MMGRMSADSQSSSQPVSARKHRFSLAALLLAPLILSPLFLAFRLVVNMVARRWYGVGIEILALGFAYPFALTLIAYRRQKNAGTFVTTRPFVWFLIRGTLFGVIFFSLLFLPVEIAEQIVVYTAPRPWTRRCVHVVLGLIMAMIYGVFFGGAAGGILGLYLSGRTAKPDQAPISQASQNSD